MARRSARLAPASSKSTKTTQATVPTSVVAPGSISAASRPAPLPIKPGVVTFLDLPGEIRNQIYEELLPQVPLKTLLQPDAPKELRHDGTKTSTRFMLACRQVYEEACSILYDSAVDETLTVTSYEGITTFLGWSGNGYARFLKPDDPSSDEGFTTADFRALTRFNSIRLEIMLFESIEDIGAGQVCQVQDALFPLAGALHSDHKLQSLSVDIMMGENEDLWEDRYHDGGWEYERYSSFKVMLMNEFKRIKPGDISRPHMTAFLTDPIRMLRGIRSGKKAGKFNLSFIGQSGKPWNVLQAQVRGLVTGNTTVGNYSVFVAYTTALDAMRKVFTHERYYRWRKNNFDRPVTKEALPKADEDKFSELSKALFEARVRGDVQEFRNRHDTLLDLADAVVVSKTDLCKAHTAEQAELWEQVCRELVYHCEELKATLPAADTDTSFFGYNLIDDSLRKWQIHGREEAKDARKKRKAEKEAKGKAAKKAKTGED